MSSWEVAKSILSQADIQRLACCYFYADHTKIDFEAASKAFGSASANSFRTMLNAAVKKVRDTEAAGADGLVLTTPSKKGRKRKEDADEDGESPSPAKKRGKATPKKKKAQDKDEAEADGGATAAIKEEDDA